MSEKLKIEPKFKNLIRPLSSHEYQQLEINIKREGCREPIITWRNTIVDGHNRYEICTRLGIPFQVREVQFDSDEDAIAWICSNQLGRRNISEETRKYLIGKRYEAEKIIGYRRNASGWNQYVGSDSEGPVTDRYRPTGMRVHESSRSRRTAERLGDEYHLSHSTVEKYGAFSKAIDAIASKEPTLAPMILSGKCRISHDNLVVLSKQSDREINRFIRRMEGEAPPTQYVPYSRTRSSIKKDDVPVIAEVSQPSIKDMPEYDPDSEITSLMLTIPSWSSSILRTKNKADLTVISDTARAKLENALCELQETINDMLDAIKEE